MKRRIKLVLCPACKGDGVSHNDDWAISPAEHRVYWNASAKDRCKMCGGRGTVPLDQAVAVHLNVSEVSTRE